MNVLIGHKEVCTCPIKPGMSYDDLVKKIIRKRKMCTDIEGRRWMCPTLLRELDAAKKKQIWQNRLKKQKEKV